MSNAATLEKLLIIKEEKGAKVVIPEGYYAGVLIGVHPLGKQKTKFGERDKVLFTFELDYRIPEGKYEGERALLSSNYTLSLNERSNLRKHIEQWLGRIPDEVLQEGFSLMTILHQDAYLLIKNNTSESATYSNIEVIIPLPDGIKPIKPENVNYQNDPPDWIKQKMIAGGVDIAKYGFTLPESEDNEDEATQTEKQEAKQTPPWTQNQSQATQPALASQTPQTTNAQASPSSSQQTDSSLTSGFFAKMKKG